ncbi:MAG: hypothetical protein IKT14_03965, partial [Clostridiales bacterium]|nr:hypothetical protein [Clostridiales bacterium]
MEQKNKKKIIFFIIALIVIIILDGLVLFGILSVVNKAPSPARLDNCDREVKIVTDGKGDLVAIENKVTDTKPVTQSYGKQRTNVIVPIELLIIIDALVIVFFVCLYNARKSLIVP